MPSPAPIASALHAGAAAPLRRRLARGLLGRNARQRKVVGGMAQPALIFVLFGALRAAGAADGLLPWSAALGLTLYEAGCLAAVYALLRSGVTLGLRDPAITLAQVLLALSVLVLNYALVEFTRSAALPLLCLVLAHGMYRLSPAQIVLAGASAVWMLVAMLFVMWQLQVPGFDLMQRALDVALAAVTLPMLAVVARQVALMRRRRKRQAAELAQAIARLDHLATHDALTGLVNRRHMAARLAVEQQRMARSRRGCCVALLDIDHFKRVNDGWGHAEGDRVLIAFAQRAVQELRAPDVVCRWGGEEFLVLMPERSLADACAAVERLLRRLDLALAPRGEGGARERVTCSAGVAQAGPDEPLRQAIERADAALYGAKQDGRDRWRAAP